jgi:hypothetical protein
VAAPGQEPQGRTALPWQLCVVDHQSSTTAPSSCQALMRSVWTQGATRAKLPASCRRMLGCSSHARHRCCQACGCSSCEVCYVFQLQHALTYALRQDAGQ